MIAVAIAAGEKSNKLQTSKKPGEKAMDSLILPSQNFLKRAVELPEV